MTEHVDEIFTPADLPTKAFAGHSFESCVFEGFDLKDADLRHARFVDCRFVSSDLSNAQLANTRVREVTFEECKLLGIQWTQLDDLVNPEFRESQLDYGNFTGLKLKKTKFNNCSLKECDFAQADLSESSFGKSDLRGARFQSTALSKADFRGAINYVIDPVANKVRGARFSMPEAQGLLVGLGVVID
jgi:uncharacterized protein YjbI with pentapeptide repeats